MFADGEQKTEEDYNQRNIIMVSTMKAIMMPLTWIVQIMLVYISIKI